MIAVAGLSVLAACGQAGQPAMHVTSNPSPSLASQPAATAAPSPTPSPTPAAPLVADSPAPLPAGTPVAGRVLPPATVMPLRSLCTTPLQHDADGNADPQFCRDSSINVEAWQYFSSVDSHVLGLGRGATVDDVKAAINADFRVNHSTNAIESSGYDLARAYYGWTFNFDYWKFVTGG